MSRRSAAAAAVPEEPSRISEATADSCPSPAEYPPERTEAELPPATEPESTPEPEGEAESPEKAVTADSADTAEENPPVTEAAAETVGRAAAAPERIPAAEAVLRT